MSRGLVLIKWWLLALPHYLVVAILTGDAWFSWSGNGGMWASTLMTDRYPPFRLDMGGTEPPARSVSRPLPTTPAQAR